MLYYIKCQAMEVFGLVVVLWDSLDFYIKKILVLELAEAQRWPPEEIQLVMVHPTFITNLSQEEEV
jgi:hypothetical protein